MGCSPVRGPQDSGVDAGLATASYLGVDAGSESKIFNSCPFSVPTEHGCLPFTLGKES